MRYLLLFLLLFQTTVGMGLYYTRNGREPYGWWGSAEYLYMWREKRFYPPLASTGVIGDPGVEILFGDAFVGTGARPGMRFDAGIWLTPCVGGGGGFILLANQGVSYNTNTDLQPNLARPFLDASNNNAPEALVLTDPGSLDIDTSNHLWMMDLYASYRKFHFNRLSLDFLAGFLFSRLNDDADIHSSSDEGGLLILRDRTDRFNITNDYWAGMVGGVAEWATSAWSVKAWGKLGLGNMLFKSDISGELIETIGGISTHTEGGFLTSDVNIGKHFDSQFELVSIVGANASLRLLCNLHLTAGYLWIYYPSVALAGRQINIQREPIQPFVLETTSFWVHGWTLGLALIY